MINQPSFERIDPVIERSRADIQINTAKRVAVVGGAESVSKESTDIGTSDKVLQIHYSQDLGSNCSKGEHCPKEGYW